MIVSLKDIVKECAKGNSKAQRNLFELYYRPMFNVCIRYVKDQVEAEDLVSQGFIKVFNALNRFHYEHENGLSGWVRRIMVNECLMFLRKRSNFHLVPLDEALDVGEVDFNLEQIDSHYILKSIAELPVGYRTVLNLFIIEGYSHAEIAAFLAIKEATSRSQLAKAKVLLKNKLLSYKLMGYGER
ncbi:MAG: sigma-70 family RNA polymerase sigma factor [Pedobacter sp.]|nr:MAG: sigma-70 family RNA polymerase sigma factor [Pedobacter sp.]